MPDGKLVLCSAFAVRARLRGGSRALKRTASSLSYLSPLASGTEMEYMVRLDKKGAANPVVQFRRDSIVFRFFFESPGASVYNRNLLVFVSMLAYFAEVYEVAPESLYPYIIELGLSFGYVAGLERQRPDDLLKKRLAALSETNASLSHELVRLSRENVRVSKDLGILQSLCAELMHGKVANGASAQEALVSSFGVGRALASEAARVIGAGV